MKWEFLREEEFEGAIEKCGGLCVVPIGCIEKHGQHLPVGCDAIHSMRLVEMAAEMEDVMIFPNAMWLGDVTGYHAVHNPGEVRRRGGIGMKTTTLLTVMEELCDEIARNGFRKILFVNGHGGNNALLSQFIRAQGYSVKPYATMSTRYVDKYVYPQHMYPLVLERREDFPYLTDEDMEALQKFAETGCGGGHADWRETAFMLYFCPDAVDPTKYDAEDGQSIHRTDHLAKEDIQLVNEWSANFPNAYHGYPPFSCSANIGKAMATIAAERLARIFKMLKEDEDCVRIAMRLPKED